MNKELEKVYNYLIAKSEEAHNTYMKLQPKIDKFNHFNEDHDVEDMVQYQCIRAEQNRCIGIQMAITDLLEKLIKGDFEK